MQVPRFGKRWDQRSLHHSKLRRQGYYVYPENDIGGALRRLEQMDREELDYPVVDHSTAQKVSRFGLPGKFWAAGILWDNVHHLARTREVVHSPCGNFRVLRTDAGFISALEDEKGNRVERGRTMKDMVTLGAQTPLQQVPQDRVAPLR